MQVLRMWDGSWWLRAAVDGYPSKVPAVGGRAVQSTLAFFPVYPLLIRALHKLTGLSTLDCGVAISFVCGAALVVALWYLVERTAGRAVADRSIVLFAFFPSSFLLSLVYAEPLMLLGCVITLYAMTSRRWVLAGSVAAVTTAVRPNALALTAALAVAAIVELRRDRKWRSFWRPAAAAGLSVLGFLVVLAFFWRRTGDLGVWFRVQHQGWGTRFDFGHQSLRYFVDFVLFRAEPSRAVVGLSIIVAIAMVVLLVWSREAAPTVTFGIVMIAVPLLSANFTGPRFLLSALPAFPAAAKRLRGEAYTVVVAVSAVVLGLLIVLYGATIRGPLTLPP